MEKDFGERFFGRSMKKNKEQKSNQCKFIKKRKSLFGEKLEYCVTHNVYGFSKQVMKELEELSGN